MSDTRSRSRQVLVCDDEPAMARLVAEALRIAGIEAKTETDPLRAEQRALAEPIDLLIIDYMMPGMDGLTLLRRLRAAEGRTRAMPVIVLTAKRLELEERAALERLRGRVVEKPFRIDELAERVRASLEP